VPAKISFIFSPLIQVRNELFHLQRLAGLFFIVGLCWSGTGNLKAQVITGFGTGQTNPFNTSSDFVSPWTGTVNATSLTVTGVSNFSGGIAAILPTPVAVSDTSTLTLTGALTQAPAVPTFVITLYDSSFNSLTYHFSWTSFSSSGSTVTGTLIPSASVGTFNGTVYGWELDLGGSPGDTLSFKFNQLAFVSFLYFQNGTSLGILSLNTTFIPNEWTGIGAMGSGWQERAVADVNGDGIDDILFQNGTLLGILIMNAAGQPASWVGIGAMNAGWELRGVADITGDGNLDLIFQDGTLLGYLEINSSGQPLSWNGIGAMGAGWQLRAVADLTGNDRPDLIFQNGTLIGALQVNTSGVPTAWTGIGAMGTGWTLSDAVDVNGDGQPDLIFQNGSSLGALQINTSFQPVAWHGIGALGTGWTLPGDY
jgi:hypothetical protein